MICTPGNSKLTRLFIVLIGFGSWIALAPVAPVNAEDPRIAKRDHLDFDHEKFQQQIYSAIQKVMPSIVAVRDRGGTFSAVVVSEDGLVLSAGHAVRPNRRYTLVFSDGRKVPAKGLGSNERIDCAMLKITDPGPWPAAELGESHKLVRNQPCISVSHPGMHSVNRGPVIRLGRIVDPMTSNGMIQSTAKMEPGDSGGPLIDLKGRVIGIHSNIRRTMDRNFEVPIDAFRKYWTQLKDKDSFRGRWPSLPTLGLQVQQTESEDAVEVTAVAKSGIAEKAGLRVGDEIREVMNKRVTDNDDLARIFRELAIKEAASIPLSIRRKKKPSDVKLLLSRNGDLAIPELVGLENQFKRLESQLDDQMVRVVSISDEDEITIRGTRILAKGAGNIISKSSLVFERPVVYWNGNRFRAKVVRRDKKNDLVLLQANLPESKDAVNLSYLPGDMEEKLGRLLISPSEDGAGIISVWGTKYFPSTRTKASGGYLGVRLGMSKGQVILMSVDRNRAADRAGLSQGDVVLKVDNQEILDTSDLIGYIQKMAPNRSVELEISRAGSEIKKSVVLGSRPELGRHVADRLPGGKSVRRDGFSMVVSHDADLRPDQCGGPVYDLQGNFLGINIARHSRARCYILPKTALESFVGN